MLGDEEDSALRPFLAPRAHVSLADAHSVSRCVAALLLSVRVSFKCTCILDASGFVLRAAVVIVVMDLTLPFAMRVLGIAA
jgi:hypothetical protein